MRNESNKITVQPHIFVCRDHSELLTFKNLRDHKCWTTIEVTFQAVVDFIDNLRDLSTRLKSAYTEIDKLKLKIKDCEYFFSLFDEIEVYSAQANNSNEIMDVANLYIKLLVLRSKVVNSEEYLIICSVGFEYGIYGFCTNDQKLEQLVREINKYKAKEQEARKQLNEVEENSSILIESMNQKLDRKRMEIDNLTQICNVQNLLLKDSCMLFNKEVKEKFEMLTEECNFIKNRWEAKEKQYLELSDKMEIINKLNKEFIHEISIYKKKIIWLENRLSDRMEVRKYAIFTEDSDSEDEYIDDFWSSYLIFN